MATTPRVWAATALTGPVRRLVSAHKDEGRGDVRPVLAGLLAGAIRAAIGSTVTPDVIHLVPLPSGARARRRRGEHHVRALAAAAAALLPGPPGVVVADALRRVHTVRDQSGLDLSARSANLAGTVALDPRWRQLLAGSVVLLVDDVVTSGATLAEMRRAVVAGLGEEHPLLLRAAVVAATERRGKEALIPAHRPG